MKLRYVLAALLTLAIAAPTLAPAETTVIKKGHHDSDRDHHGKKIIIKKGHGHDHDHD